MAIAKVVLNGEVKIDVTRKTVSPENLLSGETALAANGLDIEGNIISKTSEDLILENSTVYVPAGFYAVDASKYVPGGGGGGGTGIEPLTITPTANQQVFYASQQGYEGYSPVTVEAMPAGEAGTPTAVKGEVSNNSILVTPSVTNLAGYITGGVKLGNSVEVTAAELVSGTLPITENGNNIDVTNYAKINVNVNSGAIINPLYVTPTPYEQTFDATQLGIDGYNTVTVEAVPSGVAGTPVAQKGSVINHIMTITPRVTNSVGYISSGTITGTDITVSAAELVSGNKTITANGTVNVADFATVTVNVPTGGNGGYTWQDEDGYVHFSDTGGGGGGGGTIVPLTVTPSDYQQVIEAYSQNADGFDPVTVSAIPRDYVGAGISRLDSTDMSVSGPRVSVPPGYFSETTSTSVNIGALGTLSFNRVDGYHFVDLTARIDNNTIGYITQVNKVAESALRIYASELVSGTYSISANGDYNVTDYATAHVEVTPVIQSLTVTPTSSIQVFDATTVNAQGYNTVTVNAAPEPDIHSLTVNPSLSEQVFNSSAYDGYKPVTVRAMPAGTAGTPSLNIVTAADGHSKTFTPTVTNTTGYITGGTAIEGTSETVDASDLVSGSRTITANDSNIDVTYLKFITVDVTDAPTITALTVTPSDTQQVFDATLNNADGYNTVTVNAIPSNYIGPSVPRKDDTNLVTNMYYSWVAHFTGEDITLYREARANVTAISIQGTTLTGKLMLGDTITIDGNTYDITVESSEASNNIISNIRVTPALPQTYPVGTVVTIDAEDPYVMAPSGYYAENAIKTIRLVGHSAPTISINTTTGRITATHTQSTGYFKIDHTSTAAETLSTLAATTYYPSTTDQTIASEKYLTGAQTIKAVTMTNLTAENIAQGVVVKIGDEDDDDRIISITGTHTGGSGGLVDTVTTLPSGGDYHAITGVEITGTRSITANGTYDVSSYASAEVNVALNTGVEPKVVNFWDYDGTCLYAYTAAEANALTELPANPTHNGFTAQGWNWTLAEIKSQLTNVPNGDVNVGQMYVTTSGKTEIDFTLTDSNYLHPYLCLSPNGTISIDWGDESAAETMTGSSYTTKRYLDHVYSTIGSYTIKITVTDGKFAFYNNSTGYANILLIGNGGTTRELYAKNYSSCITAIRVGSNCVLNHNGVASLYNCKYITLPSDLILGSTNANSLFYYCASLSNITIPRGLNSTSNSGMFTYNGNLRTICVPASWTAFVCNECHAMTTITIPYGTTTYGSFNYCFNLKKLVLPSTITTLGTHSSNYSLTIVNIPNVTSIPNSYYSSCQAIPSITVPNTVTSIGTSAFSGCYGVTEYHFLSTTPPTLTNTNTFNGIQGDCKIYVPSASLSAYQTADYWSTYASYMVGE